MTTDEIQDGSEHTHSGREISAGGVIFKRRDDEIEVALISVKGGKRWGLPKGL